MKFVKLLGQLFLIFCWCLIITIGVVLIQQRIPEKENERSYADEWQMEEENKEMTVIPLDALIAKRQKELDEYISDLTLETVDASTLQVSFVLREDKNVCDKIPMLKKISSLVNVAKGKAITFKVSAFLSDDQLRVKVYDCALDMIAIPDLLVEPINEIITAELEKIQKERDIMIESLTIIKNQVIVTGKVPEDVQKVWKED